VSARRIALLVAGLAVAGGAAYGAYFLFLRPAGPPPVSLASASPAASAAAESVPSEASGSATTADFDGTWTVDTSIGSFTDFSSAFVGYRIQEELANVGGNVAVGRTPDVTGTMTIDGTSVTSVEITADLTTLKSDDDRRDGQLRRQGIQTDTYPTAIFRLASPIDVGSIPVEGQIVTVDAAGELTLHGQTVAVTVPLEARFSGDVITVTGTVPILLAEYGIPKPESFMVLSVADEGTMELQLHFTRAS
jgi:polyisoprenoid-binding protein YceI